MRDIFGKCQMMEYIIQIATTNEQMMEERMAKHGLSRDGESERVGCVNFNSNDTMSHTIVFAFNRRTHTASGRKVFKLILMIVSD